MARDDAEDRNQERAGGADRPQDPIVDRVRPDPALPPEQTVSLVGFLGEGDRSGRRRLYFTRDINYYAEFRVEDVLHMVPIPAGEPPFRGE